MRKSLLLTLALIAGTLALTLGASPASANSSIALRGAERGVASAGVVTFGDQPRLEIETITCDVTILKTMATSIPKVAGTLFGKVTGIAIDRGTAGVPHCAFRGFEVLTDIVPLAGRGPGIHRELGGGVLLYDVSGGAPEEWKLIYDGFQGVLPEIEGINYHIQGVRLRFDLSFMGTRLRCLYEGNWFKLIAITRGTAAILRIILGRSMFRRFESPLLCFETYTSSGELTLRPGLTIRLL